MEAALPREWPTTSSARWESASTWKMRELSGEEPERRGGRRPLTGNVLTFGLRRQSADLTGRPLAPAVTPGLESVSISNCRTVPLEGLFPALSSNRHPSSSSLLPSSSKIPLHCSAPSLHPGQPDLLNRAPQRTVQERDPGSRAVGSLRGRPAIGGLCRKAKTTTMNKGCGKGLKIGSFSCPVGLQ